MLIKKTIRFPIMEGNETGVPAGHSLWVFSKALGSSFTSSKTWFQNSHNAISELNIHYSHFNPLTRLGF